MQAVRVRRNGNSFHFSEGLMDGYVADSREFDSFATIPVSSSSTLPSSSSTSPTAVNCIEHRVSKMDTLAGVAIKYGVEVADIRRLNGLVTDLQMFAHKSLQIPLPGRHPPSSILSNGSANDGGQTPPRRPHIDILDSFQSLKLKPPPCKISPAMSSLRGYYGLTPPKRGPTPNGTGMAIHKTRRSLCLEDETLPGESPISDPLHIRNNRSRSVANGLSSENGESVGDKIVAEAVDNNEAERSIRRRQKADAHPLQQKPELLLEDSSGGFSGRTGKGLALRPKSGSRTDMDMGRSNGVPFGDSLMADGFSAVRKSSSTSDLQDSENSSSSIWSASKWTLKPDALARPLFDGLPKPIAVRRNKAALD